ncbi:histidine--tRNA ligase [Coxiella endosymbiont of Amblyomma americanum]|uniref:histidine--tRNA ligase n=1 Tax=Coxiella endosymbiont of Amblyomma americanum TaxID=325775 RepID=UPI00057E26D2|nr:histidine--tRNA ligase [Coxiella endosymbiont of Amblyomma americanum]AJC50520.1 histidinol dehydrogenase [Coxiella endosymbiont of Amblyomma americanum]AUJ59050.1 histidine--tRNA ligase [Coxiella-like endosymbiont of Amblyomma americanum]
MMKTVKSIRGMKDILPNEVFYWSFLEKTFRTLVTSYGYHEIRFPIVERASLFKRTIGVITDIVEKEMYTFLNRDSENVALRPEGTASCVRAGIQNGLFYNQIQRLWYVGPMFRYERPQKGRYRQFHQAGIETYGIANPAIDTELMLIGNRFWKLLGLEKHIVLQLNTLGTQSCQSNYRKRLIHYLESRKTELDKDSQRRLITNPLRILDSKNPDMQSIIMEAPKLLNYLDDESYRHWNQLQDLLNQTNLFYVVNPNLVRGLDYYTHTVFEWTTGNPLNARSDITLCAGGRYDNLVKHLGGQPTPAIGFAAGLERIILLLRDVREYMSRSDICFIVDGERAMSRGLIIAEHLHDVLPCLIIEIHLNGGSFKNKFKRADKSGAKWALIIGKEEMKKNKITVKTLREVLPQQQLDDNELITYLKNNLLK